MGTSYTGPDNPQSYENLDSFQYKPRNISEYNSIIHDIEYSKAGVNGVLGALFDTSVIDADKEFLRRNVFTIKYNNSVVDRQRSLNAAIAFSYIVFTKSALRALIRTF